MKKYVNASVSGTRFSCDWLMYETDTANRLLEFDMDNLTMCDDTLIVREDEYSTYYTVIPHCFGGYGYVNWDDEFLQDRFDEEDVDDFDVLIDYITTEGVDAEDFNFYFNIERIECDGLLELIKTMASIYGWS